MEQIARFTILFVISENYLKNSCSYKFYDKASNKWCDILAMNIERKNAESTEGKMILTGDLAVSQSSFLRSKTLKSVEAHDHHENK